MFDCPMNDQKIETKDCIPCGYWMKTITKCGFVLDSNSPTRGNGEGSELYVTPPKEEVV